MTTINHECYVSLEVAKLLKDAGFDWETEFGQHIWDSSKCLETNKNFNSEKYLVSLPTLDVAQRWLREVKDIYTMVFKDFATIDGWHYFVVKKEDWESGNESNFYQQESNNHTYEEALEAGIQTCLSDLLNEQQPKKDEIIVDVDGYKGLPSVLNLGDGIYQGRMAGHSFLYNGREYYSTIGIRCPVHVPTTVKIVNGVEDIIHNN